MTPRHPATDRLFFSEEALTEALACCADLLRASERSFRRQPDHADWSDAGKPAVDQPACRCCVTEVRVGGLDAAWSLLC